jgi:thioredoxin reductase
MKICVIGAGAAGLCAIKQGISFGCEVIAFEQTNQIGGTWVYTDAIGKDKYGLEVHSSMYQGLHTNLPKEIMGFPDFPIPHQEKSYIPAEDMLAFLNLYADTFSVRDKIKFEHQVLRVRPLLDDTWEVIVKNLPADKYETYNFDAILVCNGHYHTPALPKYDGSNVFKGKQIHSHDYRSPEPFKNERVLVIGAGPSGVDLAHEISRTAKRVTLSHHLKEPPRTQFADNVNQKPDVVRLTEDGVVFADGSSQSYTVIFFCTGYQYKFPFLSVDCGITCDNNYIRPLYKHCLSINRPNLGFIGIPFYVCASQMFDLQARFCLKFMTGQKQLPLKQEMLEEYEGDMNERWARGLKIHQAHLMGQDQNKYYADLSSTADIEPLKPVITKLHNLSSLRFLDDLTNFRKDVFRILDDETFIKVQ